MRLAPCVQCPKAWPTAGGPFGLPKAIQGHAHVLHKHLHFFHFRHQDPITRVSGVSQGTWPHGVPAPPQGAPRLQSTGPVVKASWVTLCHMAPTPQALALPSLPASQWQPPENWPLASLVGPRSPVGAHQRAWGDLGHHQVASTSHPSSAQNQIHGGRQVRGLATGLPSCWRSEHHCSHSLPHGSGSPRLQHSRAGQLPAQGPGLPRRGDRFFPNPEGLREELPQPRPRMPPRR